MQPRGPWQQNSVFVEIGAPDAVLAVALRKAGCTNYLGTNDDQRKVAALQAAQPQLAGKFVCAGGRKLVLHNNADVLILSGTATARVWSFRAVRHAEFVAWRLEWRLRSLWALVGCLCHWLAKRYAKPSLVTLTQPGGGEVRLMVSRILRRKVCHRDQLHFIPHALGLEGTFRAFDEHGVRYVVLRWFEELRTIGPGEDVDILIADESLPKALEILSRQPGIQPCDVYSETGLPRSMYCTVPYYPAKVAERLLKNAVQYDNLCQVPCPTDYFHSLAYHVVYHKGDRSGLDGMPDSRRTRRKRGHDYGRILSEMAQKLNLKVNVEYEQLHQYLQDADWGPSHAELARLAQACPRNVWLQHLAAKLDPAVHDPGLGVFVLREETVRRGLQDKVLKLVEQHGFEILAAKFLTPTEITYAAARTRGGDWTEGPYESPAGRPAACVVVYDPEPLAPTRKQRKKFPGRTNARIFAKEAIRDAILADVPKAEGFNALHSSDHAAEAWHLIEAMAPELVAKIETMLHERREGTSHLRSAHQGDAQHVTRNHASMRRAA